MPNIWPSYVALLLYHAMFEFMLVAANASLALHLRSCNAERLRGVVFGLVYGTAVGLQAVVQAILQAALGSRVRLYFVALGAIYLAIPLLFGLLQLVHSRLNAK